MFTTYLEEEKRFLLKHHTFSRRASSWGTYLVGKIRIAITILKKSSELKNGKLPSVSKL
jgi:hypothetical protein